MIEIGKMQSWRTVRMSVTRSVHDQRIKRVLKKQEMIKIESMQSWRTMKLSGTGIRSTRDRMGESRKSWRSQYPVNSSAERKSIKVQDMIENERIIYCGMSVSLVLVSCLGSILAFNSFHLCLRSTICGDLESIAIAAIIWVWIS
jgi:hypothetical protein